MDQMPEARIPGATRRAVELTQNEQFVTATKQMQAKMTEWDPKGILGITPPKIMETLIRFGANQTGEQVLEQVTKIMRADRHTSFEDAINLAEKLRAKEKSTS